MRVTHYPDEVKVTFQKNAGDCVPGVGLSSGSGGWIGGYSRKARELEGRVWDLPTKGRRKDLGLAAAEA